ncbi:hypothetical protein Q3G72_022751 [Acer saccharum]|nr:hypothetical protein Q3G72_022751 [Acer saccharum]
MTCLGAKSSNSVLDQMMSCKDKKKNGKEKPMTETRRKFIKLVTSNTIFQFFNMDAQDSIMDGAILRGRDNPPSHYWFKIESFSLLSRTLDKYSSDKFDAGGFKWNLSIYPNGDKSKNVKDHISIYLDLVETSSFSACWEVNVIVNFFTYNYLQDKYFSFQDGNVRRYHASKTKLGITKFIDLKTFSNPKNGYLIDDKCVFGVEVFIVKSIFKGERLQIMNQLATDNHSWKVTNFSSKTNEFYRSGTFGCFLWSILLYPRGHVEAKGHSISIFLDINRSSIPPNSKVYVKFMLNVKDQVYRKHIKYEDECLYASSNNIAFGRRIFLLLATLKDPEQGYLVDDTLIIEAEVTLLGMVLSEL